MVVGERDGWRDECGVDCEEEEEEEEDDDDELLNMYGLK